MASSTQTPDQLILGKYRLVRALGEGGMGQVHLAADPSTGRQVVAKFMHRHLASDPKVRQAFEREASAMMKFRHRNAVALLATALDHDPPCLILEYVPGIDLDQLAQRHGRFGAERVGRFLAQLCPVLHAAHAQGILHRDLTPVNIMVVDFNQPGETLKVMDFGLAKTGVVDISADRLNGQSDSIGGGTPDYVCPEQIRQGEVDGRGDLYSVGVLLYRLLTGHLPFESATEIDDILVAHLEKAPAPFADWGVQDVPPAVERVVMRCLNKYPAERQAHARELFEEYQQALGTEAVPIDAKAFEAEAARSPAPPKFAPDLLIDHFEAWMPEQIAVMKLRGFVDGVGGKIVDSNSGLIRVLLADPTGAIAASRKKAARRGWLGIFSSVVEADNTTMIELHMEKKQIGTRSLVELSVARQRTRSESRPEADACRQLCEKVCHELRAYLMIGR